VLPALSLKTLIGGPALLHSVFLPVRRLGLIGMMFKSG
jgi:hypothetical protein